MDIEGSGVAVRIAAGAWLRDRRGSAWRSIVVDEPFGALDASNRRALASHLAAAARSGGYRQALVVAHDAASMAALPERVTVLVDAAFAKSEIDLTAAREDLASATERQKAFAPQTPDFEREQAAIDFANAKIALVS